MDYLYDHSFDGFLTACAIHFQEKRASGIFRKPTINIVWTKCPKPLPPTLFEPPPSIMNWKNASPRTWHTAAAEFFSRTIPTKKICCWPT